MQSGPCSHSKSCDSFSQTVADSKKKNVSLLHHVDRPFCLLNYLFRYSDTERERERDGDVKREGDSEWRQIMSWRDLSSACENTIFLIQICR
jgi:hypothetical protein